MQWAQESMCVTQLHRAHNLLKGRSNAMDLSHNVWQSKRSLVRQNSAQSDRKTLLVPKRSLVRQNLVQQHKRQYKGIKKEELTPHSQTERLGSKSEDDMLLYTICPLYSA